MGAHSSGVCDEFRAFPSIISNMIANFGNFVDVVQENLVFVQRYNEDAKFIYISVVFFEIKERVIMFATPHKKLVIMVEKYCLYNKIREYLTFFLKEYISFHF